MPLLILGWGVLGFFLSCGRPQVPDVELRFELPKSFAKNTTRYRELVARAAYLETRIADEEGHVLEARFASDQWNELIGFSIRELSGSRITIRASIWERRTANEMRKTPTLAGVKELSRNEIEKKTPPVTVRVKLVATNQ